MRAADVTGHSAIAPEPHVNGLGGRLNWLRAGVLGANDGIVSVAGVLAGVAGATTHLTTILTAGVAALVAGAFSMAGGEYVSVSTQRDTESAALRRERWELDNLPAEEEAELAHLYREQGLSEDTARMAARELTSTNALRAHARIELGIDPNDLTSPWAAAGSSFVSFIVGAIIPLIAIALPPSQLRLPICFVAMAIALFITGYVSARLGHAHPRPAVIRNVGMGMLTMIFTYIVGRLFDTAAT